MSVATQQDISVGTWSIDKVHSHVGFAVKHMVVSNFRSRFEDYDGALTVGENGEPVIEMNRQRWILRRKTGGRYRSARRKICFVF